MAMSSHDDKLRPGSRPEQFVGRYTMHQPDLDRHLRELGPPRCQQIGQRIFDGVATGDLVPAGVVLGVQHDQRGLAALCGRERSGDRGRVKSEILKAEHHRCV
jgi:hypothetical protein